MKKYHNFYKNHSPTLNSNPYVLTEFTKYGLPQPKVHLIDPLGLRSNELGAKRSHLVHRVKAPEGMML